MVTKKEITERIIKKEGLVGLIRTPPHFSEEYGSEKERKQAIREAECKENEAEALTMSEMIDYYGEMENPSTGEIDWEWLVSYLDIEGVKYVVLKNGNVYFIRK